MATKIKTKEVENNLKIEIFKLNDRPELDVEAKSKKLIKDMELKGQKALVEADGYIPFQKLTDEEYRIWKMYCPNMFDLKDRLTNTLSGGEKRRLNIATLLTQNPDYLLLDEPTNHLDLGAQIKILDLIKQHIKDNNKSGIMVIHDANLANRYCDKVLMLFGKGEWASGSVKNMINKKNLERLYHCSIQTLSNENQTVFLAG